ncbi:MAG: thiamine pyrophosphate-requiring protein [Pseudomonadota bacterium]
MPQNRAPFETVADAYLALLKSRGVDWLFANAGTDFAPIIEAMVRGRTSGLAMPEAVAIAHETTAVAMAHGYTLMTGRPQAIMVHVNVGLANALMGVINASRDCVPMLVTSGRTPLTEHGMLGSRDLPIHWGQEMFDQTGIVREAVKWDYELRTPVQLEAVVDRALSIATTQPGGPVYLSLPREVLAERWPRSAMSPTATLHPPRLPMPDPDTTTAAAQILSEAKNPIAIVGRGGPDVFEPLARLAEQLAMPVVHFWSNRLALASTHPMHAGFDVGPLIETADAILTLDAPVPWLPVRHRLRKECRVISVGPDPTFAQLPMRTFPADVLIPATTASAVDAISALITPVSDARRSSVSDALRAIRRARREEASRHPAVCTNAFVSRCLDDVKGNDAIIFNELGCDPGVMTFEQSDSYFGHPIAGGLGWGVGAALGAKLAAPDRLVIACVGDGSYMFANPVACHQTAEALDLPILTVVFNNEVWNAVRKSTRSVYPDGHAAAVNDMPLSSLAPSPAFEKVIEASGGLGIRVDDPSKLAPALGQAVKAVSNGQQALLNVHCAIGS